MLIGFIARGMQSKKISRFEKQLAENIKITHNRIWTEVSKDVGYLRRILNEVYIMRVRVCFVYCQDDFFLNDIQRLTWAYDKIIRPNLSYFLSFCFSSIAGVHRAN